MDGLSRVKVQRWWNRFVHISRLDNSQFERESRRCVEAFLIGRYENSQQNSANVDVG